MNHATALSRLIDELNLTPPGSAGSSAPGAPGSDARPQQVTDLTDDSRRVTPGCLYIARPAATAEATRQHLADAVQRGAAAVLVEASLLPQITGEKLPVVLTTAEPIDQAFCGRAAEAFFDHPSRKLRLAGVTGTNGKTTTAFIIQHLLKAAGVKTGLIGTVYLDTGSPDGPRAAELTTPGAIDFSRLLAEMVANGCRAAVAETSSHALHQQRTAALRFDVAVFTNLTRDHLDYHETMEHYADAKALLFESLDERAWAVVNADDPASQRMMRDTRAHVLTTHVVDARGSQTAAPLPEAMTPTACCAEVLSLTATGSRTRVTGPWGSFEATLPYIGMHNVSNTLQALAAANAMTDISRQLRTVLHQCPQVPGRLERVSPPAPGTPVTPVTPGSDKAAMLPGASLPGASLPGVLVDYAHTNDALENVLHAVRPIVPAPGRLIVVFGCGGDRDKGKRPLMAKVACELADAVVITSDNPRTEDPDAIIRDITAGIAPQKCAAGATEVAIEPDRAAAIRLAIRAAAPGDMVLIAGKGHEDYQIIGTTKRHFDDREIAAQALAERATPVGAV